MRVKKVHIKCYNYCIVNNKHILLHHKAFCGGKAVKLQYVVVVLL